MKISVLSVLLVLSVSALAAESWHELTGGTQFREKLAPDSALLLRVVPAADKQGSVITLRDAEGRSVRLALVPEEFKIEFNAPSGMGGTSIDGKLIDTGKEAPKQEPAPELILSDGQVSISVESFGADGKREKVWFPRNPKHSFSTRQHPASWSRISRGKFPSEDREMIAKKWNERPSISENGLKVRLERAGANVNLWVEDRFVSGIPLAGEVEVSATVPAGLAWAWREERTARDAAFQAMPLEGYVQEALDPKVKAAIAPDAAAEVARLFPRALEGRALDVGRSRWLQDGEFPLYWQDQFAARYFARSAFDPATPENVILAVPNRDYRSVRLLLAPIPGKNPAVSLRLTHFAEHLGDGGGTGDALVDRTLVLEKKDGQWPEGCREVGSIRLEDGTEAPLLLVNVPLTTGPIPDLLDAGDARGRRSTQYLDLEITRQLELVMPYSRSNHMMLPVGEPSGVQVLGVTLEGAPRVRLNPRQTGNVYLPKEKTGWDLEITNAEKGFRGKLEWTRRTVDGEAVTESRPVEIPGTSLTMPLDFTLENGWHEFDFRLTDADGRLVWERTASLAQLAADTRKAGAESPYGTWWFRKVKQDGGTDDMDIVGPLFQRLGVRHTNPPYPMSAEKAAAYGVTLSMLPKIGIANDAAFEAGVKQITEYAAAHPAVNWGMIFHEDVIPGFKFEFPPEFIGREAAPLPEDQRANLEEKLRMARKSAEALRKIRPGIRLMAGNGPLSFHMALMRHGYPKDLVDAWGDETTGQAILPETPPSTTMNTLFWLREYAKKYGYDVPVTTNFEWTYRSTKPEDLTPLDQARFYTRDLLLALAYEAPHINPTLLYDTGDAYYYGRWGASGLMSRYPVLNPKPSYVAYSVLTRELDQAKYQRNFPTDSPTTNVMEFRHGDEWIYVLWIPRGERTVEAVFEKGVSAVKQTDMMGRETSVPLKDGVAVLELSGSPIYIRSSKPLAAVRSGATRLEAPTGKWEVVEAFDDASRWTLAASGDVEFETYQFDYPRELATFQISANEDASIRLTLQPEPEKPWPIIRYGILQTAVPLPGKPESIGVWVRGNSSWGRIFFELEDAKGRKLTSTGRPEEGWSLNDWRGEHFVNFDGWNFIQVRLPAYYGGTYPMPQNADWKVSEDGPIAYPVKLTGIIVEMREKVVRINEVVEVPNLTIDLKNLSIQQ